MAVWLLESRLGQFIGQNWWNSPSLTQEVNKAGVWQDGGCKIVAVPWVEGVHYFLLVAVFDQQPIMFILESIRCYPEPSGAGLLVY